MTVLIQTISLSMLTEYFQEFVSVLLSPHENGWTQKAIDVLSTASTKSDYEVLMNEVN